MKGIIFTEFLDLVERKFGLAMVDRIVVEADLTHGGAYASAGTYDFGEMLRLVAQLSDATGIERRTLALIFGRELFPRLAHAHRHAIGAASSSAELLPLVGQCIHFEVRKLFPDAETPQVDCRTLEDGRLEVTYRSSRPFADVAEGLVRGCADFFGEQIELTRRSGAGPPGTHAVFEVRVLSSEGAAGTR